MLRPLALALALGTAALPALAQEPLVEEPLVGEPPSAMTDEEKKALAREHYEAGKVHYTVGEFREALARFAAAYKLRPSPLLLFNMGQCHRLLGEPERAVFFFEGYLREAPEGQDRAVVEELLVEERAKLEAERARKAEEERSRVAAAAEVRPVEPALSTTEAPRQGRALDDGPAADNQLWLWAAGGSAAAAAIVVVGAVTAAVLLWPRDDGLPDRSLDPIDLR